MIDRGRYTMIVPRFDSASGPALIRSADAKANTEAIVATSAFLIFMFLHSVRRRFNLLVSCPRNTRYFAGGQLAVFHWPRPKGLR
jgi:hypothetical protein